MVFLNFKYRIEIIFKILDNIKIKIHLHNINLRLIIVIYYVYLFLTFLTHVNKNNLSC